VKNLWLDTYLYGKVMVY